jgi:N-acetylglutamate synthase-like GNAT family acetyltransferase
MSRAEIRRASPADLNLLLEWRERVLRDVFDLPAAVRTDELMAQNRRYYESHMADGTHEACFAVRDGNVVGCGGLCLYDEMPSPDNPSGRCAYLMNVYAEPAARGRGVATQIVAWLVGQAEAKDAGKVYLETTDAARRLYEKAGFGPMDGFLKLEREPSESKKDGMTLP